MAKEIPLTGKCGQGKSVLVDDEDYSKYGSQKWYLSGGRYAARKTDQGIFYLHRIVMNAPKDMVVDHKNHNTLDCRKRNLRICTQPENCKNTLKCKGYYFDRWADKFNVQYRGKYYGRYATEEAAKRAYRLASSGLGLEEVKRKIEREFNVSRHHCA